MYDISKYTPNAQKYIRYGWAACRAGEKGDDEEFERILEERHNFKVNNFTLEDYDSMIEDSSDYPPECQVWRRAKERYITEHQQMKLKKVNEETSKTSVKCLRKTII